MGGRRELVRSHRAGRGGLSCVVGGWNAVGLWHVGRGWSSGGEVVKPYYDESGIVIYHGDCREVLPSVSADLLIADPPYNVGKDYGSHDDSLSPEAYEHWCRAWLPLLRAASSRVVVFPGHGNLGMWHRISTPSAHGCWYKPGNPASSHIGYDEWEPWLYWGQRVGGSSVIRATNESGAAWADDGKGQHPCPKPLLLYKKLIAKFKPQTLLDPFLGSGTATLAAKQMNIRGIGIEIEERYCEIAVKRLAQGVLDVAA